MSFRNRELANLVVVGLLTGLGFASVYIARQDVISTASLAYAVFFLGLYLCAHVFTRLAVPHADPYLLPLAGLLTAIGVVEIYRLNPRDALKQSGFIVVGLAVFAATLFLLRRDYRRLESYKYIFGLTAIGLLALPVLPVIGQTVNGSRLWIHFGSIQFQPGELAKISLILFLAAYLREKREVLAQGRPKDLGPLLVIWLAAMGVLFMTKDLGGALLFFGIFLAMLYGATGRAAYPAAGLVLFLAGSYGAYESIARVRERVDAWLHTFQHAHTTGYQTAQGLYAIANGQYGGTGLGKGTFTNVDGSQLIPYVKTDMIYAALGEELGLIGASAVLLVFVVFVLRGMRTALLADDGFSKLLAIGLTFGFALQTFIIVGGVLRLIPLTGITLPFVSYGGSSILANFILLAGLLLVSNRANAERRP